MDFSEQLLLIIPYLAGGIILVTVILFVVVLIKGTSFSNKFKQKPTKQLLSVIDRIDASFDYSYISSVTYSLNALFYDLSDKDVPDKEKIPVMLLSGWVRYVGNIFAKLNNPETEIYNMFSGESKITIAEGIIKTKLDHGVMDIQLNDSTIAKADLPKKIIMDPTGTNIGEIIFKEHNANPVFLGPGPLKEFRNSPVLLDNYLPESVKLNGKTVLFFNLNSLNIKGEPLFVDSNKEAKINDYVIVLSIFLTQLEVYKFKINQSAAIYKKGLFN